MKNNIVKYNLSALISGGIFPVINFGYNLVRPNTKGIKISIVLFYAFFGYSILWASEGTDISVYAYNFIEASHLKISYYDYVRSITYGGMDYYWSFMTWFVSRFTTDVHLYFCIISTIYGFFLAANSQYILERVDTNSKARLLLVMFVLIPGFILVTHRWWTALQVFLFGLLPVIFEKRYSRIIFCALSAFLIHFSFIYPLVIVLLSIILPKKSVLPFLVIYYISIVMSNLDFSSVGNFLSDFMPSDVADRTVGYMNSEKQEHSFLGTALYQVLDIINVLIISFMYFKYKVFEDNNKLPMVAGLLIATFANICAQTEWGWRYLYFSNSLLMAVYIYYYATAKKRGNIDKLINWCMPLFVFVIVFQLSGFANKIGPLHFFVGNLFSMWFLEDEIMSLFEFIL